jgi:hypothetical protein
MEGLKWRKASRSGANGGDCVEVARGTAQIAARDSKDPGGEILWFSSGEWQRFIARVRAGELDT